MARRRNGNQRRLNPILLATVSELGKTKPEQELGAVVDTGAMPCGPSQEVPQRSRTAPPGAHSQRARQRWQLALILARNPSLRRLRKTAHGGPRADTAPPCLGTEADTLMPLRLPGLPSRRLESSSTSFWSPLSRVRGGNRTPLLSESAPVFPPETTEEQP
eukprot:Skav209981  [mRNA]  locus=scaffold1046:184439:192396:+ [translate_table: standard]